MKQTILSILIIGVLTGCNTTPVPTKSQVTPITTNVVTTLETATPTEVQVTPTATAFPGIAVAFDKVNLVIPLSVASGVKGNIVPLVDGTDGAPWWAIAPEHLQLDLEDYILQDKQLQPQILIYPTNEYDAIAENITRLNTITKTPNQLFTDEILPTPLVNAVQLFASNKKVVSFQNGQGVRYVTQVDQYYAPINNYELFYYFSGLTNDQKYYITATLPISASNLPDNVQPGSPPVDITGLDSTQMEAVLQEYYNNMTTILNNTQANGFTPDLDLLDALINSISIVEGE